MTHNEIRSLRLIPPPLRMSGEGPGALRSSQSDQIQMSAAGTWLAAEQQLFIVLSID